MDRRALGRVLEELRQLVFEFQRSQRPVVGKPGDFVLGLWNSIGESDNTPTVNLGASGLDIEEVFAPALIATSRIGFIESKAPAVEEGLREVLTQFYDRSGRCARRFRLTRVPVGAFGGLMQELAAIGSAMGGGKFGVGRCEGPTFSVTLDTINYPRVRLFFTGLDEKYSDPLVSVVPGDTVSFISEGGLLLDMLEDVIAQARAHIARVDIEPR